MLMTPPVRRRVCFVATLVACFAYTCSDSASAAPRRHRHHATEASHVKRHHRHASETSHNHHRKEVASHRRHHGHTAVENIRVRSGSDLVRAALAYRGTPYVYGGAGRGGFDCSGFTSYLYERRGISLPHSARSQFEMGRKVTRDAMKPGDLVFFHTVTPGISHVGMYIGNGRFIHASSRRTGGVRVDSLDGSYYQSAFRGARRLR